MAQSKSLDKNAGQCFEFIGWHLGLPALQVCGDIFERQWDLSTHKVSAAQFKLFTQSCNLCLRCLPSNKDLSSPRSDGKGRFTKQI